MAEIRLTKLSEKLLTTGLLMLIITGILLYKHNLTSETSQLNKIPEVQNKGFPVEYLPASNTSNKKLIYLFSDLELPVLMILNEDNRIIEAWKAEPEKIHLSRFLIEKHIN